MNNKFASWGIPSELQIQRHPRICHWKYLQHASMETECLLSCQLVLVLELLVLFLRWLLPWWGSLSDAHACNPELTVRSCVEEKVWTVQNVIETWWASSILFSSHLKQILGLRGLWSFFLEIYLIWFDPWVCLTIHTYRTPGRCPQKPEEGIKWKWSYSQMWSTVWVLGDWTQVLCSSSWCF